ncbi:hypothetical protein [Desertibacillus haloalkaliphilus]|uniref:hypothetical protein n=1 Tax=Desertibacillus haloalkaliphilus TaxID=1328930 RepID=UPI001C255DDB|nr:hypothetical protein [Desertibacillus haloalkaliphilus]MBU8905172.1 hypothetical protein [Desertibacillus haloalkaliphilus]
MNQRLLLCLLLALALLYFGLPRLPFSGDTVATTFAFMWLAFALMVVGGNMVGLLYGKKKRAEVHESSRRGRLMPGKSRRYDS